MQKLLLFLLTNNISKKFQSWEAGKVHETLDDRREIKRAKAEGRLAETLLDRREKVKADRYCK